MPTLPDTYNLYRFSLQKCKIYKITYYIMYLNLHSDNFSKNSTKGSWPQMILHDISLFDPTFVEVTRVPVPMDYWSIASKSHGKYFKVCGYSDHF